MTKNEHAALWSLHPDCIFLNHGSYGASPIAILEEQSRWRTRIERQPVTFYKRDYPSILADVRLRLMDFIGASDHSLAFTRNATSAVNIVLRNFEFEPGDEIVLSDFTYPACRNAIAYYAKKSGAVLKYVPIGEKIHAKESLVEAFKGAWSPKTKLVFLDHVNSPLGVIFPVSEIIATLGVNRPSVLIDGAHAPGMLPLDLDTLDCDYYVGNVHKWLCAPKSGAFLACRAGRSLASSDHYRGMVIGHGNLETTNKKDILLQDTDWPGTFDPSPILCLPKIFDYFEEISGSWQAQYERNHLLAVSAYSNLCERLGLEEQVPENLLGSMAPIFLGDCVSLSPVSGLDPLQDELFYEYGIEVPLINWFTTNTRILRISAQLYNSSADYKNLGDALEGCEHFLARS